MIDQYHKVFNFLSLGETTFVNPIMGRINHLPAAVAGASRSPALLKLIYSMTHRAETVEIVTRSSECVEALIMCISTKADNSVIKSVMEILTVLLDKDNGVCLFPYSQV